jgi:hypothetical protein
VFKRQNRIDPMWLEFLFSFRRRSTGSHQGDDEFFNQIKLIRIIPYAVIGNDVTPTTNDLPALRTMPRELVTNTTEAMFAHAAVFFLARR